MAAPYSGTSVSGYNANPPPDDGTTVSTNLVTWGVDVKGKIGDPLNNFATNVDANITTAFGKTLDGASLVTSAVDYAASAADQGRLIKITVSGKTVTTPDAGTVTAPFIFAVKNQSGGTINLAPNATNSQKIDGATATLVIQDGGGCFIKTDGTDWFTIGFKAGTTVLAGNNYGFVPAINANISCSVGSSLLTVALKTKAGNDPSASDPVLVPFRDTTLTAGDPVWLTISSALSINTNAVGATLASQNSTPFRFWILLFNNGGTPVLALWHSGAGASAIAINPLNEGTLQSTTPISGAATSAGVFYTPNGTTLTTKAFRILGYLEYTSGLATAGTYSAAPDIVQLFGPGIKKPGDVLQMLYSTTTTGQSVNTTVTKTALAMTISPSSACNLIKAQAYGIANCNVSNNDTATRQRIYRSSAATAPSNPIGNASSSGGGNAGTTTQVNGTLVNMGLDAPNTTSSTPYSVYVSASVAAGGPTWLSDDVTANQQASMMLQEIQA